MKFHPALSFLFSLGLALAPAQAAPTPPAPAGAQDEVPQIYCYPGRNLAQVKEMIRQGDPCVKQSYEFLMKAADQALSVKPGSVMDKPTVAASGDKHDYFSYAPFWWPDPTKTDGLPYIKRDGYTNPSSKVGTDAYPFFHLCSNVDALADAYYFTGQEIFATKAALLLRVWFLNPATAMNPSLNYAQAIPGGVHGRAEGLIELRRLTEICDATELITPSGAWTTDDQKAFRQWHERYQNWLAHEKLPVDDTSTENNHKSWDDIQIIQIAIVLGKKDYARTFLQSEFPRLLEMQLNSVGGQPYELARAWSLHYSIFNIEALLHLATLGDAIGVDCWKFSTKDHNNLKSALDFVVPYVDPAKPWPIKDVTPANRGRLLPMIVQAYDYDHDPKYKALLDQFCKDGDGAWRLVWPYRPLTLVTVPTAQP